MRSHACILGLMVALALAAMARAQLAITEVMSSASPFAQGLPAAPLADFWELSNFSGESLDLTGYQWNDSVGGLAGADRTLFQGVVIQGGESILLVQTNGIGTEAAFRSWWGPGLDARTRVLMYGGNGFNVGGDEIFLWAPGETDPDNWVAHAVFWDATQGVSFTYGLDTGEFGIPSRLGDSGVFRASTRDDIGSPGRIGGAAPLRVVGEPADLEVCVGQDAVFEVQAFAMPPPQFQWHTPAGPIAGANHPRLRLRGVKQEQAGQVWVEVRSGDSRRESRRATLSVRTDPRPPRLDTSGLRRGGLVGESIIFDVSVCAFPEAQFQWYRDGVPLEGETQAVLKLTDLQLEDSGAEFCLVGTNDLGSDQACLTLEVERVPKLVITEVFPSPSTNCLGTVDWFEVTNADDHSVNLQGYKWATLNGLAPTLDKPLVIDVPSILRPGESLILVERLSPAEFRAWWGADRLPPDLQVLTYTGQGLSRFGDSIQIWGPGATDPNAPIASASWIGSNAGVSREFDLDSADGLDRDSVAGLNGAFEAEQCQGVGSPGYVANPPPRFLDIRLAAGRVVVRWRAVKGATYRLQQAAALREGGWRDAGEVTAGDWVVELSRPLGEESGLFRLVK